MQFTREINRLLAVCLIAFGIVGVSAAYWAVVGPETLLRRPENPRLVEAEASIRRGGIYDRRGLLLAETQFPAGQTPARAYLYPEMNGALGYFSLRYGAGGAEAAYNAILRGDGSPDFAATLANSLLHRSQVGADVQLTLDREIQAGVAAAMRGQRGAAVVLSVPDGEVLALVNLPTYDPNRLDADWDTLRADPGNPFFNRALQGNYQPGGTLETPLMAAALLYNHALDAPAADATAPVTIDRLTLNCAVRLPNMPLDLRESYDFACPASFARLSETLGESVIAATFSTFGLDAPPVLPGFVPADTTLVQTALPPTPAPSDLVAGALGQSRLTVTPLGMAVMAAAIANDGNAPEPYALMATRPPGAAAWQPVEAIRPTTPIATTAVARQLQDLMRDAVANGAAQNAGRPSIDIGGHATLSYSGDGSQAWFVGFATLGGRRGVAVAVVLENSDDPGLAADIGGASLAAAQRALATR